MTGTTWRIGSKPVTPAGLSDETLAAKLRDGDPLAGDELVRRYAEPLLRYLQRIGGGETLAEELHQQTWASVLEHIDRFDTRSAAGGFKAWLFRIATNKANDHWRGAGRQRAATEGLKLVTDHEAPAASARLESTQEQEKLLNAIDQLPENQKQVVLLRYYGGMKFVDIAQTLGCPLNTALGRMHKAMLKLREMMDQ